MPKPVGDVTVIVPVGVKQFVCTNVAIGVVGVGGCALIVTFVPAETHPSEFFAVAVYEPEARLNIPTVVHISIEH